MYDRQMQCSKHRIQNTAYSKHMEVAVQRARALTAQTTAGTHELPANALHLIRHRLCEHQATRWTWANGGGMRWWSWTTRKARRRTVSRHACSE